VARTMLMLTPWFGFLYFQRFAVAALAMIGIGLKGIKYFILDATLHQGDLGIAFFKRQHHIFLSRGTAKKLPQIKTNR